MMQYPYTLDRPQAVSTLLGHSVQYRWIEGVGMLWSDAWSHNYNVFTLQGGIVSEQLGRGLRNTTGW